ncbi:hypothetical protein CORC01_03575 [Colletotrichum orchidophilum]|uniref:Uncharacterized protein n=1 Tax=Colletotrichum orchidophilum TaxID=1209926 RepID=A0A1G4BI65_9PEZI|nr:uncharacterized protein CORC01_03575 [Colletotrichum orchidophilum]OHF01008.1 hypothetical protein CORC01_03575 [Colletotrichum orchidophilum]
MSQSGLDSNSLARVAPWPMEAKLRTGEDTGPPNRKRQIWLRSNSDEMGPPSDGTFSVSPTPSALLPNFQPVTLSAPLVAGLPPLTEDASQFWDVKDSVTPVRATFCRNPRH